MEDKKLVMDSSGLNPFQYSIRNKKIAPKDLGDFFEQQNIKLCATKKACSCGEFSYVEQGDFYTLSTFQSFNNQNSNTSDFENEKDYTIGENGTIIENTDEHNKLKVYVDSITINKDSESWIPKISEADKSSVLLAQRFLESNLESSDTAILAHDKNLKKHANKLSISTYGSSALLASMVISGIYSYQKGTSVYYSWHRKNTGWIPKDITFKNVLSKEKDRVKNNKSFFINH